MKLHEVKEPLMLRIVKQKLERGDQVGWYEEHREIGLNFWTKDDITILADRMTTRVSADDTRTSKGWGLYVWEEGRQGLPKVRALFFIPNDESGVKLEKGPKPNTWLLLKTHEKVNEDVKSAKLFMDIIRKKLESGKVYVLDHIFDTEPMELISLRGTGGGSVDLALKQPGVGQRNIIYSGDDFEKIEFHKTDDGYLIVFG